MTIHKELFGELDGQPIHAYTLKNNNIEMTCIDYGCIITKLSAPDKQGNLENIVLGFDTLEDYQNHSPFFGAVIGRVAGRIKNAAFDLDGTTYELDKNDGDNNLHGGLKGFDKVVWTTKTFTDENKIEFTYTSPDMEEGFPGELTTKVTYIVTAANELVVTYEATTTKRTLVNLTNHTYFNLSGDLTRDVLKHQLTMKSSKFLELGDDLLPTGEVVNVDKTTFDFRTGRYISDGVNADFHQNILAGKGYDHPFMLDVNEHEEIVLSDEESGRVLVIETTEPCVVLYTGNQLDHSFEIRGEQARKHLGLCLETQGPPDSIHHPNFPSSILDKGETYQSKTTYSFKTKN